MPQGSALAGLASIFRKGPSKKLSRSASSGSGDRNTPPPVKVKPKKKISETSSPDLSRVKLDSTSGSSSPGRSSFKLFRKKKGRLSRESSMDDVTRGSIEDLRSETSSLSSMSRVSIREEDAFEIHSPIREPTLPASPLKEASVSTPQKPLKDVSLSTPQSKTLSTEPTTSTPVSKEENPKHLLSPTHDSTKDRSDSLFKDMSELFGDKSNLFDSTELNTLLAKAKTDFKDKEEPIEEKPKEEEPPEKLNKVPVVSTTHLPPIRSAPSKPMRKNRSRVLDPSIYDKAAESAIKATKERKIEREREKDQDKEREEKKKPTIVLFEEAEDDDDLFKTEKTTKKDEGKTKTLKDDLLGELDKDEEATTPPADVAKEPSEKTVEQLSFADDSKTDKPKEEKVPELKPPLLADRKEEQKKKDVLESLFGDDSEGFASKLSSSSEVTSDSRRLETSKEKAESKAIEGKTKIEIENEERSVDLNKNGKNSSLFEDPLHTEETVAEEKKKPPVMKKPSITSPTHKEATPSKTKPPIVSAKPKRTPRVAEKPSRMKEKSTPVKDKIVVNAPREKEVEERKKKSDDEQREKDREMKQKEEERKEKEEKETQHVLEKKMEEEQSKEKEEQVRENKEEKAEGEKNKDEKKIMKENQEEEVAEEQKKEEKEQTREEKQKSEEQKMKEEKEQTREEKQKSEEQKMKEEKEQTREEKQKSEEEQKMKEEKDQTKEEKQKSEKEEQKMKEEKEQTKEEKQKSEKEEQKKKQGEEQLKKEKEAKKVDVKEGEKKIPEWKRKLEERRLQREKEEKESAAKLEERKRRREESRALGQSLLKDEKQSTTSSSSAKKPGEKPSSDQSGKPSITKEKSRPPPISTGVKISVTSVKTKPEVKDKEPVGADGKEKSPISPISNSSGTPPPKELSPTIDPSLPKWKQDLLARKKASGGAPTSPRRSTVSAHSGKKEEEIPAWKKELLAKKKDVTEVIECLEYFVCVHSYHW